jgi:hypothetical protein
MSSTNEPNPFVEWGYAGHWAILMNFEKEANKARSLCCQRSQVAQYYDNLKNDLDMMRVRTH